MAFFKVLRFMKMRTFLTSASFAYTIATSRWKNDMATDFAYCDYVMYLVLMMYACLISGSLINKLIVIIWPISIYTGLVLLFCINAIIVIIHLDTKLL